MATITVYTAERMKQIEDESVVSGYLTVDEDLVLVRRDGVEIQAGSLLGPTRTLLETMNDEYVDGGIVDVNGHLILTRNGGGTIDAGNVVGPTGATGPEGPAGTNGTNGVGVPAGGATGKILKKLSATDYDTGWADDAGKLELIAAASPSGVSAVSISSIPQTYSRLLLIGENLRTDSTNISRIDLNIRANNDATASMYMFQRVVEGVSPTTNISDKWLAQSFVAPTYTYNPVARSDFVMDIYNYIVGHYTFMRFFGLNDNRANNAAYSQSLFGTYRNTNALTSLDFSLASTNFTSGTLSLYGVV